MSVQKAPPIPLPLSWTSPDRSASSARSAGRKQRVVKNRGKVSSSHTFFRSPIKGRYFDTRRWSHLSIASPALECARCGSSSWNGKEKIDAMCLSQLLGDLGAHFIEKDKTSGEHGRPRGRNDNIACASETQPFLRRVISTRSVRQKSYGGLG